MNGKIKKVVSALGLVLLISVPSISYAKEGDYTIDDIGKTIQPPQYVGTDNKLIENKIPSVEDWKKSVESQAIGGGDSQTTIYVSKDQKEIKVKKVDKNGKPLQGVEFKLYLDSTMDSNDTEYSTGLTDKNGIVSFAVENFYYGGYIKETKTLKSYILRDDEKDTISLYKDNGVRFLGEITPDKIKIQGITTSGASTGEPDPDENTNGKLQSLVIGGQRFNGDTNWLVFNDNGTEKLVSKKPLKYGISWDSLYRARLVFGRKEDALDPSNYTPTYVTINNKKYVVRLMRAYNENIGINDSNGWGFIKDHQNAAKASEWNRLILPLIDPTGDDNGTGYDNGTSGRYGQYTKDFVEKNMPTLANYSWWTDFGGSSQTSGKYVQGYNYGAYRWTQERRKHLSNEYRTYRGNNSPGYAASSLNSGFPHSTQSIMGWIAVLERVDD